MTEAAKAAVTTDLNNIVYSYKLEVGVLLSKT